MRSIAWWEGSVTWASYTHRFEEMGGGELPGLSWPDEVPSYARTGEVDSIDGVLIVMSPWAVRNLRFDESLGNLHGYDLDICLQARAAGKKVVTTDLRVIHHHPLELLGDPEGWIAAHMRIAEKWSEVLDASTHGRLASARPPGGGRARRRPGSSSGCPQTPHHPARRRLRRAPASGSWRLTAPLRRSAAGSAGSAIRGRPPGRELGEGVVRSGEEPPASLAAGGSERRGLVAEHAAHLLPERRPARPSA